MAKKMGLPIISAAALALIGAASAGIAYSALAIDHRRRLWPAFNATRSDLETDGGRVAMYAAGEGDTPLLLIHSINAASSAYEVRPLFEHYAGTRPVYAIDLPGYGLSERRDQTYTPRIMVDAIHAALAEISYRHQGSQVDLMALSISCEYAARAVFERPDKVRTLGLISPTAFDKALAGYGRAQSTKGNAVKLAIVSVPLWSQALFDLVVSRASMRFFLRKTFGSKCIDEGLFADDQASAHQPGARYVVWSFLSGYLFADDATRVYNALTLPIWTCHGRRGDFVDYSKEREVAEKSDWHLTSSIQAQCPI